MAPFQRIGLEIHHVDRRDQIAGAGGGTCPVRRLCQELFLSQFTQDVPERNMTFLNPRRHRRRDDKGKVHQRGEFAAGPAGPSHGGESAGLRRFHALEDIRRIAAGADRDGQVAFLAMGPHLAGKEFVIPVVVGDAGDRGDVGGEGNGRQWSALAFISADEFRGDMGGIRCTASVSEQQYFVAFAEGRGDQFRDLHDSVGMFADELLLDCRALVAKLEGRPLSWNRF